MLFTRTDKNRVPGPSALRRVTERLESLHATEAERVYGLVASGRLAESQHAKGRAAGAHLALGVIDKGFRGWHDPAEIPRELRQLADMYSRQSTMNTSGHGYEIKAKAEVLEWASHQAHRAMLLRKPVVARRSSRSRWSLT